MEYIKRLRKVGKVKIRCIVMINFTVGPVQSDSYVLDIGANQTPYFRTAEFSEVMIENEKLMLKFANAPQNSKVVFITGSGSASMEATVMNTLSDNDKVIVVNGGSFGQRFVDLLDIHNIKYSQIKLEYGNSLTPEHLKCYDQKGYTAFVVNIHETSTGVKYDIDLISDFCKRNNMFLIVDAISSFLADEIDMEKSNIDVMITGSQKALACPPGISIITLSPKAVERVNNSEVKCMYLNLKNALSDAVRGQTPFTPAVSILLQINARLRYIDDNGGVKKHIAKVAELANYFRKQIIKLPFNIASDSMSNAVTPLIPLTASAYDIFKFLKDEYGIWVCPNGGELADKLFRVGHIGALSTSDYDKLLNALEDLKERHLI